MEKKAKSNKARKRKKGKNKGKMCVDEDEGGHCRQDMHLFHANEIKNHLRFTEANVVTACHLSCYEWD